MSACALLLLARHFDTPHYWKAAGNVWTHNPRMQLCKQAEHASLLYHLSQTGKFSLENNKAARPS